MELGIKALICDVISNKAKVQEIFLLCKHDVYMLFGVYETEVLIGLSEPLILFHWEWI